jgi:hypothetical protein
MAIFRSHRDAARANNRMVLNFYYVMLVAVFLYGAIVAVHYLLGWW